MSLVNLPTMPYGDLMAVNPHHVTAVQPYSGHIPGEAGKHDMCIVWVARDQGTNLFVCTWDVVHTLAALGAARQRDRVAFEAGYRAALGSSVTPDPDRITTEFQEWQGRAPLR